MSTFGNLLTLSIGVILLSFAGPAALGHVPDTKNAQPVTSEYAKMMGRKMGANYEFNCPEEINTGTTEAVELIIRTSLSSAELNRLIDEIREDSGNNSKAAPCLVAKLDFIDTDGLIAKSITKSHQKLIPNGQNQWSWQLKARKPGDYLLSLTLSLCVDNSHGEPIATPIAFNRRLRVVGEPVVGHSHAAEHAAIFAVGVALAIGGIFIKFLLNLRNKNRDRDFKIRAGGDHKIFVSYSKHDRNRVEPIIELLKKAGHQIWIDRHAIDGASTWREEIVEALSNSDYFLFFASADSYRSINCGKELSLAADEGLTVIPVQIADCKPAGAGKFIVAGLQRVDARTQSPAEVASTLSKLLSKKIKNFNRPPSKSDSAEDKEPESKIPS